MPGPVKVAARRPTVRRTANASTGATGTTGMSARRSRPQGRHGTRRRRPRRRHRCSTDPHRGRTPTRSASASPRGPLVREDRRGPLRGDGGQIPRRVCRRRLRDDHVRGEERARTRPPRAAVSHHRRREAAALAAAEPARASALDRRRAPPQQVKIDNSLVVYRIRDSFKLLARGYIRDSFQLLARG